MEEQKERDMTTNVIHRFYFVRLLPSPVKVRKKEFEKQYQLITCERIRINEELAQQKESELQINQKLRRFSDLDKQLKEELMQISDLQHWGLCKVKPSFPTKLVPRSNGFIRLTGKDAQSHLRPDRKRCQKKLIKKSNVDIEYLQQVYEEHTSLQISNRMISSGTPQLNDMIESMVQRIQHGNKKPSDEAKMYQEISKFEETKEILIARQPNLHDDQWHKREPKSKRDIDEKRSIQHEINIRLDNIQHIKRLQIGRSARVSRLKADLEHVKKNISYLDKKLKIVNSKCLDAYKDANPLREQKKQLNSSYNEYQLFKTWVKGLARKGNVVELENVCNAQVEGFMRQWNDRKEFREDYENKKIDVANYMEERPHNDL